MPILSSILEKSGQIQISKLKALNCFGHWDFDDKNQILPFFCLGFRILCLGFVILHFHFFLLIFS